MVTSAIRRTVTRAVAMALVSLLAVAVLLPTAVAASEGCTPGYWKNPKHFDDWPVRFGLTPDTLLREVSAAGGSATFDPNPLSNETLLDILKKGGGGIYALGRHTVAGLLSAGSSEIDYSPSRASIIRWFNAALASGELEALKDRLEEENESGCPL